MTHSWLPVVARPGYEQRQLVIASGAVHASSAAEWADAIVLLQRGSLELECQSGARRTFQAKAMLCLEWLPLRGLRNTGAEPAVMVAVRRRKPSRRWTTAYHEGQW